MTHLTCKASRDGQVADLQSQLDVVNAELARLRESLRSRLEEQVLPLLCTNLRCQTTAETKLLELQTRMGLSVQQERVLAEVQQALQDATRERVCPPPGHSYGKGLLLSQNNELRRALASQPKVTHLLIRVAHFKDAIATDPNFSREVSTFVVA